MNLVLFEPDEVGRPLALSDPRAAHILGVLGRREGDLFDAGIIDGKRGKAAVAAIGPAHVSLTFDLTLDPLPGDPVHLLVALPRPQTARKILGSATSLGVASIRFFRSSKGEPGYASSTLWRTGEWRAHLVEGAAQAFDTRLPAVAHDACLADSIAALPAGCPSIALDNYEASRRMTPVGTASALALAFGPERGWSADERNLLRRSGFVLAHLGPRVLRTETALVAAVAVAKAIP